MKVSELIEKLKIYDKDTEVEVCIKVSDGGYYQQGSVYEVVKLKDEHLEFVDFNGNQFVKKDSYYHNKKILTIGGDV